MRYHLTGMGVIAVKGLKAADFLQGQLTCDIKALPAGSGQLAAHCHPQGRVISLFHLGRNEHAYYLVLPKNMIPLTLAALNKYAAFHQAILEDQTDHWQIEGADDTASAGSKSITIPVHSNSHRRLILSTGKPMLEISDNNFWHTANLNDGLPTLYPATAGTLLPHELGLEKLGAIDFEKGCYTGQEIIARIHYRGKVKNHLYHATLTGDHIPLPGDTVYYEQNKTTSPCGMVVDVCAQSPHASNTLVLLNDADYQHTLFAGDHRLTVTLNHTDTGIT